jgi:hypothetical protein
MTIRIAVMNESTVVRDAEVQHMLLALQLQWNRDLQPVWGVSASLFQFVPKGVQPHPADWWLVFLDDSDQAGALAYHDLTAAGLPIGKVFCKTLLADKASISVGASHECLEMAVDPWLNSAAQDANNVFWSLEVGDPCEAEEYAYRIGDVLVSDFVTPDWFGHPFAQGPLDHTGHVKKNFEVLSGGYAQRYDNNSGWVQVTGDKAKSLIRATPPVGSRRERRMRGWADWIVSQAR